MKELEINFCGTAFANPFVLPSGIITEKAGLKKVISAGAGGVTLKSLTKEKREGNPMPRVWKYDCGVINSVGIQNPGIEKGTEEVGAFLKEHPGFPAIVSLFATKTKEFEYLVEKIAPLHPPFIELNLSCPNVEDDFGKPLGMEKGAAEKIVKAVKKISGDIPVLAKLSPSVADIAEIAKACEAGGADGIVAINTAGPGMIIDINRKKPVLGAKKGGVSGPGIFPIAVRCVYEIYEAVKIPILGMGGVSKWQDTVQMMLAGATLVGVGTATYGGMEVFNELKKGLSGYLKSKSLKEVGEVVGLAHSL